MMFFTPLKWEKDKLVILDQTLLPLKEKYLEIRDIETLFEAIVKLRIRGAPLLGIAGAFGVYLGIKDFRGDKEKLLKKMEETINYLAQSRPTAVNLFWGMERVRKKIMGNLHLHVEELKEIALKEAQTIEEDIRTSQKIGEYGSEIILQEDSVLTHCNAGGLATSGYGTALAVLFKAHEKGKKLVVYVDETRPLLQGARLTTWELQKAGIETYLICDNMAGVVMKEGKVKKVIIGADRVASNGDTANKIGSYSLAILAHYHSIPFYIACPVSTIDFSIKEGKDIPIEERSPEEILTIKGERIAPHNTKVYNPAFDVVPYHLITAFITEKGLVYPPFEKNLHKLIE